MTSDINKNILTIKSEIAAACELAGRDSSEVKMVAVSKTVSLVQVERAIACGVHDFGENRSVLFIERQQAFPDENWHFIGSIQTNKIKHFVGKAALVHSLASKRALLAIDRRAEALGIVQDVLIEVNTSGESSKDGIAPTELNALLDVAADLSNICVRGLMTMAAPGDLTRAGRSFAMLRELRDAHTAHFLGAKSVQLKELSMGMSDDFTQAIQEGATIVRIGRSLWL